MPGSTHGQSRRHPLAHSSRLTPKPLPRQPSWRRLVLLLLLLGGLSVGALLAWNFGAAPARSWWGSDAGQTLVVRRGGTYSGTYRSTDSLVPCIRIETTEPVTLDGCQLEGAGALILASTPGAQLTVVNCRGVGLLPSRDQSRRGRFLEVNEGRSVRVEHNYFEQTTGISIYQWSGDGTPGQTLTVRYNQCRNLDGRLRNGGEEFCNFLGLNGVSNLANVEVSWNEVINEPDKSLVEDNVNFYNSGGTRLSPLRLHNNYIQGAYPYPSSDSTYTGSGVTLDGDSQAVLTATAFVNAYDNQIISTCNSAMNIAAGHNNHFYDNRIVSSGYRANGTKLRANWAAAAIWNCYNQQPTAFHSNRMTNNVVGYYAKDGEQPYPNRRDWSPGVCTPCTGVQHLPNPITLQTEQAEFAFWQQKLRQRGISLGPKLATNPLHAEPGTRRR